MNAIKVFKVHEHHVCYRIPKHRNRAYRGWTWDRSFSSLGDARRYGSAIRKRFGVIRDIEVSVSSSRKSGYEVASDLEVKRTS